MEFLKTLPHLVKKEEVLAIPLYQNNTILEKNRCIKGFVTCNYYNDIVSIRESNITVSRGFLRKITLTFLLDARSRN